MSDEGGESPMSEVLVSVEPLPNSTAPKPTEIPEMDRLLNPDFLAEVTHKPITSPFYATVLHLRARTRCWSRFRGFRLFFSWAIERSILIALITALPFMHSFLNLTLASMAETSLVPLLTHLVPYYHLPRNGGSNYLRPSAHLAQITPAVALRTTATQIPAGLPMLLTGSVVAFRRTGDPNF